MAHFCGFIKLIFLLLMLARIPANDSRPLKGNSKANSDIIAGNEFLKLFMSHDQLEKDLNSNEYIGGGSNGNNAAVEKGRRKAVALKTEESFDKKSSETGRRGGISRSLKDKGPKLNQAEGQLEDSKQVVKLVTSGSKIVFLEDYDENDAILDAEARDIDLKKEIFEQKKPSNFDDYKVLAVSVSSSSQRGKTTARNRSASIVTTSTTTTTNKPFTIMPSKPPTATTVRSAPFSSTAQTTKVENIAADNFINRSHKSEFSIEEVEPVTMTQHQARKIHSRHRTYQSTSASDTLDALDSENSASTNIQNILAAPLQPSASARSMVTTTYHSGQRNMTINHDSNLQDRHKNSATANTDNKQSKAGDLHNQQQQLHMTNEDGGVEDQLLPFQTVIYHDTKAGHGPQSRSISYSSISQNVEDLKKWQQSGILAEARRNVSESLKPMIRSNISSSNNQPEPSKFFSQPSKMYSEPSKFYSEPAKVYSEPSKVYGEPEKFYSEPAKVYGQPAKFYSEPAKVYSQPAKVYSQPSKTYWPILSDTTTSTQSPSSISHPTIEPLITTTPQPVNIHQSSRKPAIVSRIAFGEAHLISSTTSTTTSTTTTIAPLLTTSKTYGTHSQHQYSRTDISHRNPSSSFSLNNENSSLSSSSSTSSSTPSRRILFNLDRLPYDLLNAPEPSIQQQQLLELQKTKRPPQQTLTYQKQHQYQQEQTQQQQQQQQHQQQKQMQRHHINPCLESAVSSLFSSSSLSAHPALKKQQQQQQASLPDHQQHSNQNAKGLPNGDLVRCVAEISHTSSAADDGDNTEGNVEIFTTERSHIEELFAPTPEHNYEIAESVSVMTNGRPLGGGGRHSFAHPTTSPAHQQQHHGFKPNRQRTRIHFGTNVNNPTEVRDDGHQHHPQLSQMNYNTNANANAKKNNNQRHHTTPDYSQYDDGEGGDAAKNNDYDDGGGGDGGADGDGSSANGNNDKGNNGNGDDSKVAYIVEGQNYRKYRVEEETDDGFIVGEYGVVDHNDGNLRGVRYTADSTINRSLIQKALLTFLKLK